MKVKVIKCGEGFYWYRSYIGKIFEVQESIGKKYLIKEGEFKNERYIDQSDCEILNSNERKSVRKHEQKWKDCYTCVSNPGKDTICEFCNEKGSKYKAI